MFLDKSWFLSLPLSLVNKYVLLLLFHYKAVTHALFIREAIATVLKMNKTKNKQTKTNTEGKS